MIDKKNVRVLMFTLALLSCPENSTALENAISFDEAYNEVFYQSYDIKAAEAGVAGRAAEKWQAGRHLNPILTVEGENLGHNIKGNENELFFAITQPIELGDKRLARERLADAAECESYWFLEVVKNDVSNEFLHAFVSAAAAQERTSLAHKQASFAKEALTQVKIKTETGKGSGMDAKRAEVAFSSSGVLIAQQQATLQQQMRKLRAFWDCPPSFSAVNFPLFDVVPPPSLETLSACIENNPSIGMAQANASRACRQVELERAQRMPTIAVQFGVSTEEFYKDPTVTVGVDIPLTIFDRNSGNIDRAVHEHSRAVYEQLRATQRLLADLEVTHSEWLAAYNQAMMLKNDILPGAEEAHEFSREGYLQGKLNYLEYLDSQRTLLDAQMQYVDAVETYHHKRADVLKLAMTCATTN